ncbi:MAG: hypothetical protein Q8R92_15360 [Deltaproteobacteria bacterium]|nr:hypothetical protein [Deltaproteobacteria bacterium]
MKRGACLAVFAGAVVLTAPVLVVQPMGGAALAADGRIVDLSGDYNRTRVEFESFLQNPDRFKDTGRWDGFADRFRRIYETDRGGPRADEALYMVGEVNYERHRVFRRREYLDAAISAFTRLLDSYRYSSMGSDALVGLADIHYYNLDDPRRAYLLYRRAARDYADTEAARRARVRLVAIEAQHPEFASADDSQLEGLIPPAGSGKPLPSPGAVVGGRTGGRPATAGRTTAGRTTVEQTPAATAARTVRDPAPPPRPVRSDAAASAPGNPLLQKGPNPFKRPSDDLPVLSSPGP